jgi:hypothetical protein
MNVRGSLGMGPIGGRSGLLARPGPGDPHAHDSRRMAAGATHVSREDGGARQSCTVSGGWFVVRDVQSAGVFGKSWVGLPPVLLGAPGRRLWGPAAICTVEFRPKNPPTTTSIRQLLRRALDAACLQRIGDFFIHSINRNFIRCTPPWLPFRPDYLGSRDAEAQC